MKAEEFHNALRVLLHIDRHELERAGIIGRTDHDAWGQFRRDPFRWAIRADDDTYMKLWSIIKARAL